MKEAKKLLDEWFDNISTSTQSDEEIQKNWEEVIYKINKL